MTVDGGVLTLLSPPPLHRCGCRRAFRVSGFRSLRWFFGFLGLGPSEGCLFGFVRFFGLWADAGFSGPFFRVHRVCRV